MNMILFLIYSQALDFVRSGSVFSIIDIDAMVGAEHVIGTHLIVDSKKHDDNLAFEFSLHSIQIDTEELFDDLNFRLPHRRLQIADFVLPENPLLKPSALPTATPTVTPSSDPTATPTTSPSSRPTLSMSPSSTPSTMPSGTPTSVPSVSFQPSSEPTSLPSSSPTSKPTSTPSDIPSKYPSTAPTSVPTVSTVPTVVHSVYPTKAPVTSLPTLSNRPSILTVNIELSPIQLQLYGLTNDFLSDLQLETFNDIVDKRIEPFVLRFARQQYPTLSYIDIVSQTDDDSQFIDTDEGFLGLTVNKLTKFKATEISKQDIVLLTFEMDLAVRSYFDDIEEVGQLLLDLYEERSFKTITKIQRNFSILNENITESVNLNEKTGVITNDVASGVLYDERSKWYVSVALLSAGGACAAALIGMLRSGNKRNREIPIVEHFPRSRHDLVHQDQEPIVRRNPIELYTTSSIDKIMKASRKKLFTEDINDHDALQRDIMDRILSGQSHEV